MIKHVFRFYENDVEKDRYYKNIMHELNILTQIDADIDTPSLNIINLIDYFECLDRNASFFVFDYYQPEENLENYLKKKKMSPEEAISMFVQLLNGLNALNSKKLFFDQFRLFNIHIVDGVPKLARVYPSKRIENILQ